MKRYILNKNLEYMKQFYANVNGIYEEEKETIRIGFIESVHIISLFI